MIYRAQKNDVADVARLHVNVFPNFFLTSLGLSFLEELYSGFLHDQTGIFFVAKEKGEIIGFVVGTSEPHCFFSKLRRRRFLFFTLKAIPGVLRSPINVFRKLLSALSYRGGSNQVNASSALLSSIGVADHYKGKAIAKKLITQFEQEVLSLGKSIVYLTTDAQDNDRANSFYHRQGYVVTETFYQSGSRKMICYQKNLQATIN
jgi:ribosomal protein S18 acetylase RimI-like enzyme